MKFISGIRSNTGIAILGTFFTLLFYSCAPEGLINKVKYEGEKITNTCDSFAEELDEIMNNNGIPDKLVVAEYDNSDFDYFYLDPGQFEIKDGNLCFRFAQDIDYGKYLQKGVAIEVILSYASLDHLANIESPNGGDLGVLTIDEEYYNDNKEPFFLYKFPISQEIDGRNLTLQFSVIQFKKNGDLKKVFCDSREVPLGPLTPACCDHRPWEGAQPQSIVEMPELEIADENYRYKGFTGTLDFIFGENSTTYDKELLASAITNYVKKYEDLGYKAKTISIDGYASMGGTMELNQKLSENRAAAIEADLRLQLGDETIQVSSAGKGEDWNRFNELLTKSALSAEEKSQAGAIAKGAGTNDEKEAAMRELPFWDKMVEEVIINTRHTFVTFKFDYQKDKMYVEEIPGTLPVISDELYKKATEVKTVKKWNDGADAKKGMKVLDVLIGNNKKPNLFAMRSTYYFGANNFKKAIADIDEALKLEKGNMSYAMASLAYKTKFSDSYSLDEKMEMLDMYNNYVELYPNNRGLFFNRAIMMDKVGYISGALTEYDELLEGTEPSAKVLNNRGVAKMKTNRLSEAEADFKGALQKDANLGEAHFNLAVIYAVKGLSAKTIENLTKAVNLNPSLKSAIFNNRAFRVMSKTPAFDQFR